MDSVVVDLMAAYGSMEQPNWSFVEKRFQQRPYAELVGHLSRFYNVEETTDLNEDCSQVLNLSDDTGAGFSLRLSLIGRYAMAHDADGKVLEDAILQFGSERPTLKRFLQLANIELMTMLELRKVLQFGGQTKTIYQVLFSGDDLLV